MTKEIKIKDRIVTFCSEYDEYWEGYTFVIKDNKGFMCDVGGTADSDQIVSKSDDELIEIYESEKFYASWEETVKECYNRACISYECEKPHREDFKDEESYQKAYDEWWSDYPNESDFD